MKRFTRNDGTVFELTTTDANIVYRQIQEEYAQYDLLDNYSSIVECGGAPDVNLEIEGEFNIKKICKELFPHGIMNEMFNYDSFCEEWARINDDLCGEIIRYIRRKMNPPRPVLPKRNTRI